MEKTLGTHQELGHTSSSFDGGDNPSNRNITLAPDHSGPAAAAVAAKVMKHNPGIAMDWTTEEQSVLEEGLRAWVLICIFVVWIHFWVFIFRFQFWVLRILVEFWNVVENYSYLNGNFVALGVLYGNLFWISCFRLVDCFLI